MIVVFLAAITGSSVAHATEPSQEGACYVTDASGTTCFVATSDDCETHNNREYDVTAQWVAGACGGEETHQVN